MKERDLINRFPVKGERIDYGPDDPEATEGFSRAVLMAASAMAGIIIGIILMGVIASMGQNYNW